MNCPNCKRETEPALFCPFCDVYLSNPQIGTRAGVARRFAAQLLDVVSVWLIFFLVLALAGLIGYGSQSLGLGVTSVFWTFIGYVVFALWFLSQGKTPGKWLVGIRVVDKRQGSLPGLGRMLVRETIGKIVSGFFLGLGYFWAIFDRDGQAWHDKIAGTAVLREAAGLTVAGEAPGSSPIEGPVLAAPPPPPQQTTVSSIIGGPTPSALAPPQQPTGGRKIPILVGAVAALLVACVYLFYQLSTIRSEIHEQITAKPVPAEIRQPSQAKSRAAAAEGRSASNNTSLNVGGGTISVEAATYGPSCNVTQGNDTTNLARLCNGRVSCTYTANNSRPGGDPAQGCNKDYIAQYRCSGDAANLRVVRHPAIKNESYSVVLDCLTAEAGVPQGQTEGLATNQIDPSDATTPAVSIRVEGDRQWTDSGIMLRIGEMVSASASGEITVTTERHVPRVPPMSPVGYPPDCTAAVNSGLLSNNFHPFPAFQLPCWSLIGRIGTQGPVFELGAESKFQAATPGELYLGVNDENVDDNAGTWMVNIALNNPGSSVASSSADRETTTGDGGVYKPGGDVTNPIPIYRPEPKYSEEARKARLDGTVLLSLVVDENGHTADIKVLKSLGLGLDEKAIEAVSKWLFKPGMKDGKPVKVAAQIAVTFRHL
jgi:TonB family protein